MLEVVAVRVVDVRDEQQVLLVIHVMPRTIGEVEGMKINLGDGFVEVTAVDDVDLDTEDVHVAGKRLTESEAGSLGEQILQRHARKRAGRPSLGEGPSPRVSFRVSVDMRERLAALAEERGLREADLLREALQEYLAHH